MSNVYDADDEITNINNEYADVKVAHEISGKIISIIQLQDLIGHSTVFLNSHRAWWLTVW